MDIQAKNRRIYAGIVGPISAQQKIDRESKQNRGKWTAAEQWRTVLGAREIRLGDHGNSIFTENILSKLYFNWPIIELVIKLTFRMNRLLNTVINIISNSTTPVIMDTVIPFRNRIISGSICTSTEY